MWLRHSPMGHLRRFRMPHCTQSQSPRDQLWFVLRVVRTRIAAPSPCSRGVQSGPAQTWTFSQRALSAQLAFEDDTVVRKTSDVIGVPVRNLAEVSAAGAGEAISITPDELAANRRPFVELIAMPAFKTVRRCLEPCAADLCIDFLRSTPVAIRAASCT
jgi:hypothetical protein